MIKMHRWNKFVIQCKQKKIQSKIDINELCYNFAHLIHTKTKIYKNDKIFKILPNQQQTIYIISNFKLV